MKLKKKERIQRYIFKKTLHLHLQFIIFCQFFQHFA